MNDDFFEHPIMNSPYEEPARHWELDKNGWPAQQVIDTRRRASYLTPIPRAKRR